jgi:hypothetical protein
MKPTHLGISHFRSIGPEPVFQSVKSSPRALFAFAST